MVLLTIPTARRCQSWRSTFLARGMIWSRSRCVGSLQLPWWIHAFDCAQEWLTCCDISVELAYRHAHALEHIKSSKSNLDLEMLSYHLSGVCSLESHEFNPTAPDAQVEQQITEISDAIKTTAPTKMPMSLNLWKRKRKGLNPELEANRTSGSVTARAALESYDSFNAELSGNPIDRRMVSCGSGIDIHSRSLMAATQADCSSKLLNAAWGQGIAVTSRGGEVGSGTVTGIAIPKLRVSHCRAFSPSVTRAC